jgi:hypothetical protein
MPQVDLYETQFRRQWNTHIEDLTISQKCHLIGVMAIQMEWDQNHPADGYTLATLTRNIPLMNLPLRALSGF